jgi:hypothetical protein
MSLSVIASFGILGLLVFGGLWLLVRRQRREAKEEGAAEARRETKEEGAAEARRETLEIDSHIIERQRDATANRPDPHRPDDVLDRL